MRSDADGALKAYRSVGQSHAVCYPAGQSLLRDWKLSERLLVRPPKHIYSCLAVDSALLTESWSTWVGSGTLPAKTSVPREVLNEAVYHDVKEASGGSRLQHH